MKGNGTHKGDNSCTGHNVTNRALCDEIGAGAGGRTATGRSAMDRDEQHLSSVTNALRILQSFSLEQPEKNVTTLASELGLAKSTVSRLLSTLAAEGFVFKRADTRKYSLGLSVLNLNTVLSSRREINRESLPVDALGASAAR